MRLGRDAHAKFERVYCIMRFQAFALLEWKNVSGRNITRAFYHLLALVWIAKGLVAWCVILGVPVPLVSNFENLDTPDQTKLVLFSILDLVAGVALWLSPQWGGVVWLIACLAECVRQLASDSSAARELALAILLFSLLLFFAARYAAKPASNADA